MLRPGLPPAPVSILALDGHCERRPRNRRRRVDRVGQREAVLRPRPLRGGRDISEPQLVVGPAAGRLAGVQRGLGFLRPDDPNTLGRTAL
jgi:hypothetical protein